MLIDHDPLYIDFLIQDLCMFSQIVLGQTDKHQKDSTFFDPLTVWIILLLIMLGGTAISYFLFFYPQKSSLKPDKKELTKVPNDQSTSSESNQDFTEASTLIIAVSVNYPDVINILQNKDQLSQLDWEKVYDACEYLNQSSESLSLFNLNFINANFQSQSSSEYDVYFIKVYLNKKDDRFHKGVNQLDRLDAFRDLTSLAKNFELSERLKIEVYNEFDLYSR
jgi:hypothetical protein